ncbi:recombination regulator RecX [Planobispora rosea]|uniref:recombination regulator RecX n=1 Tax=Planobispora rosea TaxID=35762 RepID=UPI000A06F42A|nr:recombination regulator RecX [Planobispora rosea]
MTTGPDSGPAGEAGPRDWGAWPDLPESGGEGRRGSGTRGGAEDRGRSGRRSSGGSGRRSRRGAEGPSRGEPADALSDGSGGSFWEGSEGVFPDGPEGSFPGRSGEASSDGPEGSFPGGSGRRSRGGAGSSSREGAGRRSRGGPRGFLPDGPVEGSTASQGPPADPQAVARAICLRLLTMAPRTRAQLAEALRKREVPEDAAEAVLERFSEVGLIDDEAFAAAWVSSRHAGRGLARRALASELRRRGVEEDTVKEAVEQLDPEQEVETARRLVARKLPSTRGLEPAARTRRLAGMLARKGYGPGLAFRVIREALENEEAEGPEYPEYPLDW